jgi:hypothetical protein
MIEEELVRILRMAPGVAELVGNRIYNLIIPQDSLMPAIVYQAIAGNRLRSHSGSSGFAKTVFQVSCFSDDGTEAKALAEEVRKALECYHGGDVFVIFVEGPQSIYDPQTQLFYEILTVRISAREVV